MDASYQIILIGALLLLVSLIATNFSARIGMPILLVFLIIGMLAGEQGPGHIQFQNTQQAHLMGTIALAIILLSAGLHTKYSKLKEGALPAMSLSLVGTLVTAILIGLFSAWLLKLSWLEGLLLGAIIAPTDAAAIFSFLQLANLKLKSKIAAILEIESGSNDPLAILLTISLIELLQFNHGTLDFSLVTGLFIKITISIICSVVFSRLAIYLVNKPLKLTSSLCPLLIFASGMTIFAATELLRGSGYLAVYFSGIIIGNSTIPHRDNILLLHNSFSWLSQICMFLMLGLFVTPSALLPYLPQAFLMTLFLLFLARPIAVVLSLLPFRFSLKDQIVISWLGLRGAVPIILAINTLLVHLNHASLYFNITFFIVIFSITLQGWSISPLNRWLTQRRS